MNFSKNVLALSIALAVGSSTAASKPQDDDSVHQWGRWAVLVPEAGGEADPFIKVEGAAICGRRTRRNMSVGRD